MDEPRGFARAPEPVTPGTAELKAASRLLADQIASTNNTMAAACLAALSAQGRAIKYLELFMSWQAVYNVVSGVAITVLVARAFWKGW